MVVFPELCVCCNCTRSWTAVSPSCIVSTAFCSLASLRSRLVDSSHWVAGYHASICHHFPSTLWSIGLISHIPQFSYYLYFFGSSLVYFDPWDIHDSHLLFVPPINTLQKSKSSKSYHRWLLSTVCRYYCHIINVLRPPLPLLSRRRCISIVTCILSLSISSRRFCFFTSFSVPSCRRICLLCCRYPFVISYRCRCYCHNSFVALFADLLMHRFRFLVLSVGDRKCVFHWCLTMIVRRAKRTTGDDDWNVNGVVDVLLPSWMMYHRYHALHTFFLCG